jgi:hypothetical protein
MPAMLPALWISPLYMPLAARGAISRKGVLGSSSSSSFFFTGNFPDSRRRLTAFSERSSMDTFNSRFSASTRARMDAWFFWYSSDRVSILVSITLIFGDSPSRFVKVLQVEAVVHKIVDH